MPGIDGMLLLLYIWQLLHMTATESLAGLEHLNLLTPACVMLHSSDFGMVKVRGCM